MMAKVKFNSWEYAHYKKDRRDVLARILTDHGITHHLLEPKLEVQDDESARDRKFFEQEFYLDITELIELGFAFDVKESEPKDPTKGQLAKLLGKGPLTFGQQTSTTNITVHAHDNRMLDIRHVDLLEDCCTDNLKRHLEDGWHILAVCPQYKQRRPDYIICKIDPNRHEKKSTSVPIIADLSREIPF